MVNYKFREGELIKEFKKYIDSTYDQHYAGGKIQATEDIIDDGHGTGFCIGNGKKYLKRYGKKGETPVEWRKDLMKVLHYTLIQLYVHDKEYGEEINLDYSSEHEELRVTIANQFKDARYNETSELKEWKNKKTKVAPFHHDPSQTVGEWNFSIDNATSEEWNEVNRKLISDAGGLNPDVFSYSD